MNYRNSPYERSFTQPMGAPGQSPFPGISDPFWGGGGMMPGPPSLDASQFQGNLPSVIQPPGTAQIAESGAAAAKGGFNLANSLSDLKGMVDRLGGIDGILSTVGKVQKVVANIQQMAPLIKLLVGSFGKKGGAAAKVAEGAADAVVTPRRRKRHRTGAGRTVQQRRRARTRKR